MTRSSKINLIVGKRLPAISHTDPTHHTQVVVEGKGDKNFQFPDNATLVGNALKRADKDKKKGKKTRQEKKTPGEIATDPATSSLLSSLPSGRIVPVLPQGQTKETFEPGKVLLSAADGMQSLMTKRQFEGLYDSRFGRMSALCAWASTGMSPEFQPAVASLTDQLVKLQDSYKQALPEVIAELSKRNPGAPAMAIVQKAVELLDEELAQILYVLRIYTDCFEQKRDGKYSRILNACEFFFKCVHQLYWSGDLDAVLKGEDVTSPIKSGVEKVGDVFLARLQGSGLATIPGSRGPIGAHALQIPFEMLDFLLVNFPLFCHEARHNVYHDVLGLEAEEVKMLQKAILDAVKSGDLKLSVPTIALGKQKIPTEKLLVKLFTDSIGEIDADAIAVLFTGKAFGENMVMSFPAMMIRDGRVSEKVNLLRTSSHFDLIPQKDGSTALQFGVHPVDYVRVYFVAACFDEIGFPEEATRLRELADFAVGDEIPEFATYTNSDEKSTMEIKIPTVDLKAAAAVVVKSLIRTPYKALGGKSNGDLVMWNQKRQDKVDALVATLVDGKADIPTDKGDILVTYVAAAATLAYVELVKAGKMDAEAAAISVSENAMKMLETLQANAKKTQA